MEVMVVMLIVGILVAIAIPNFGQNREANIDNEALVILDIMNAAERFYYIKMGSYYPSSGSESDINNINQDLKLDLSEINWDYLCENTGCVQATRIGGDGRSWHMQIDDEEATSGACP